MAQNIGLIGFGEAGRSFAIAAGWARRAHVYDLKTDSPEQCAAMQADYADAGVAGCESAAQVAARADLLLSLVTADQALPVAELLAVHLLPGALLCDMNSVAPQTKRASAAWIEAAGGDYVDVAVMAPVAPAGLAVPLLLSGAHADRAATRLADSGFTNIRVVGAAVGQASTIKMLRSVMVKGIEALTAECLLAAEAGDVREEVLASLDAGAKPLAWSARADYNLDRMMVHGMRRAAEMAEVVKTLDALGTGSAMARATADRQRAIGGLSLGKPEPGLAGKLRQISGQRAQAA